MTTSPRVLRKRVGRLRLRETEDLERLFPPAFDRLELWADTVEIEGWVRLHGRDVTLHARRIEARPLNGRPAVLDVSGAPAEPDFDPRAANPGARGRPTAPHGQPGRDGGPGRHGGRIRLAVDGVDGELGLAANGSRGGDGERGGDGVRPATLDGADGRFTVFAKGPFPIGGRWPVRGPAGGRVLVPHGVKLYAAWAAGEPGDPARVGGNAGRPGAPGRGGDGGSIDVRHTGPRPPQALRTTAVGGAAGCAGAAARPGLAGKPGAGGRHLVYVYGVFAGTHQAFARTGSDKLVDQLARRYRIPARAAAGKGGARPGTVPATPVAEAGTPGTVQVAPGAIEDAAAAFDLPFLRLVLGLAGRDRRAGEVRRARDRLQWLARITGPGVAQGTAGEGMPALARDVDEAMAALDGSDDPTRPREAGDTIAPAPTGGPDATRRRPATTRTRRS